MTQRLDGRTLNDAILRLYARALVESPVACRLLVRMGVLEPVGGVSDTASSSAPDRPATDRIVAEGD